MFHPVTPWRQRGRLFNLIKPSSGASSLPQAYVPRMITDEWYGGTHTERTKSLKLEGVRMKRSALVLVDPRSVPDLRRAKYLPTYPPNRNPPPTQGSTG